MKTILVLLSVLLLTIPAYGKNNKHQNQHKNKHHQGSGEKDLKKSNKHSQDHSHDQQKKVARGGDLPPGWQKKMRKGHRVGDDLYQHMRTVDRDTLRLLPPLRHGEYYKSIENNIIKLKENSREILKVIKKNSLRPPPQPPFF